MAGGISPDRVLVDPPPGTATKRDLLRWHYEKGKRVELVAGILVENTMGSPESFIAVELIRLLGKYLDEHDLGFLCRWLSLIELFPGIVRGPDVCFISWDQRQIGRFPRNRSVNWCRAS